MDKTELEQAEQAKESIQDTKVKKKRFKPGWRSVSILLILAVLILSVLLAKNTILYTTNTTEIGLKDIGELATQSAFCTQVGSIEDIRKIWKIKIPFTKSKSVYSYNIIIKAGYDFDKIEWTLSDKTITVNMPEVRILSSSIDPDSFTTYFEDESLFNNIDMTEYNGALKSLQKQAEETAVNNGLYDGARKNARIMIEALFRQHFSKDEYKIVFEEK